MTKYKTPGTKEYKKMLALACDNPFIQYNIVEYIINQSKDYDCCIPRWDNGFVEHLFAIYPTEKSYERTKDLLQKIKDGEKCDIITTHVPPKTNRWSKERYKAMQEDILNILADKM